MSFPRKCALAILSALCISVCAENPLGLPEYSREYELTFRSPAEAESAVLTLSPLPKGKKVLFSCRWDDCNDRHLKTAAAMRETGCRGTFYLCQAGPTYYQKTLPLLLEGGNTIGNHTLHHYRLTKLSLSELWREIIENRYEYEVRGNLPVTAFSLPFCAWREEGDPDAPKRIGTALRNAGMLGAPEFWRQDDGYGYPKGCFIDTALTIPGDKEPSESRFDADIQRFLKEGVPHITLGMHSNHTPAGLAALRRILKKSSDRPDWLCCNENEAIARILAARVTRVEKIRVRGSTACFRLTGPTPAALGHPAPLSGHSGDQWFELPHKLPMPTQIALFKSNVSSDELQISPQIDLFRAALKVDPSEGSARLNIKNCGAIPAGALEITLRMPGCCKPGLQRRRIEKIEPGASESIDFRFSLSPDADGNAPAAAEIDLQYGTKSYRLWVISEIEIKKQTKNEEKTSTASGQIIMQENFDAHPGRSIFSTNPKHYEAGGVNGSHCAVFRDSANKVSLLTAVIDPKKAAGKTVLLEAKVCCENVAKPAQAHLGPKVTLYYKTASGKQQWIDAPKICDTTSWKEVQVRADIPQDVTDMQVLIGIQRTGGVFRVDDVKLSVLNP